MDLAFLLGYVALLVLACLRARSIAWLAVSLAGVGAVAGAAIAFARDRGWAPDRLSLQVILLAVLAVVVLLAWVPRLGFGAVPRARRAGHRQFLAIGLPMLLLAVAFLVITTFWTDGPAFLHPVGFLIGHGEAEDNAKWLEFAAQFASGGPIRQGVPLGGPLELVLTGVATALGVVSQLALGGYNEVAVAANTIVFGEFAMIVLAILALAPLVEARVAKGGIPAPAIWAGVVVLIPATLVLVGYGHLTLQYTIFITTLWSATFVAGLRLRRARLLTSLAVAVAMTVWLPLSACAVLIICGLLVALVVRGARGQGWDVLGIVLSAGVGLGIAQPIVSSLTYSLAVNASGPTGGAAGGLTTMARAALQDSPVFSAGGGTEQVGPVLGLIAVVAVVAAVVVLRRRLGGTPLAARFIPIAVLALTALGILVLDAWITGSAPHYGSLKFGYLVAVVAAASCLPVALLALDRGVPGMTGARWAALGGVVLLLGIDSLLPRAIAYARPQQWSPPIPFNNTSGSYWYPAEVNGGPTQAIALNPVACVYLPKGSTYPTAIVPSGLSDAQRVYACTRQLAGLAGASVTGQPLVDWLRREWLTNTPAWTDVYDGLAAMPADVLAHPVILLDDGSNVIGVESVASLLQRFPKPAATG